MIMVSTDGQLAFQHQVDHIKSYNFHFPVMSNSRPISAPNPLLD
uniref:Uncharacterized protein n=1 Tax=Rhizophora mucronata TaxID=61149 RepID=A0A2P2P762_RHIMU